MTNRIHADSPWVEGDVTQLWRVFSNLITNALNHNPHGIHITLGAEVLSVATHKRIHKRKMLRCTIQDNGIGIPQQQQPFLFNLYSRGSRSRYTPGLGLGLHLCQQIVQAHGGEIGVLSRANQGATFWFTLPL